MEARWETLMDELRDLWDEICSMTGDEISSQMFEAINSGLYKTSNVKVQLFIIKFYKHALQAVRKREDKTCDLTNATYTEKAPQ